MRTIIEELYYGNICPADRGVVKGGEYANLLHLLSRNDGELTETLTEAQQETFQKYKDCAIEINSVNEIQSFTIGFKLGLRLAVEAMISTGAITEPKMK